MARKNRDNHNIENTEKHLELTRIHMRKMKADFTEAMEAAAQKYEELNQTLDTRMRESGSIFTWKNLAIVSASVIIAVVVGQKE